MTDARPTIATFLPNLCGGGAERVAVNLANGLAERGYRTTFVLSEAIGPYLADVSPNVRVVDLHRRHVMTSIAPLARYLRSERPDVLFSHLDYVSVGALLARRLARVDTRVVPVVHVNRSQGRAHSQFRREPIVGMAMKWLYPGATRIVVVSRGAADDLVRTTGVSENLIRVIYNPVITPQIKTLADEPVDHPWFAPGQPGVILGIGRLTYPKDFDALIRAFALLRRIVDCRLLILGDGEDRDALEGLVKELGLTGTVQLPGFVKNPFSYLSRSSLFVLSSTWEALPTVLIEAMACGCPVVSTDCPTGPREILDGGKFGRLAPVGDIEALSTAMSDVLKTARIKVPEAALQPFLFDTAVEEYVKLIGEITHA